MGHLLQHTPFLRRKCRKGQLSKLAIHTPYPLPTLYRWSPAWAPKFFQALSLLIAAGGQWPQEYCHTYWKGK